MNIALLGYGKMGKLIEKFALEKGHNIVLKTENLEDLKKLKSSSADVAIDFSVPQAAFENIKAALELKIPVISGTTGWLDNLEQAKKICEKQEGKFLYASNFSLGVNIFFMIAEKLSSIMKKYPDYKAQISEIHHTQKLDKPSGTAISLAQIVLNNDDNYKNWCLFENEQKNEQNIPIIADRKENYCGFHKLSYKGTVDEIELSHNAFSRDGFALGALIAAEWLVKQPKGVKNISEMLSI